MIKYYLKVYIQMKIKIFEGEYYDGKKWNGTEKKYDEDTDNLIYEYIYIYK